MILYSKLIPIPNFSLNIMVSDCEDDTGIVEQRPKKRPRNEVSYKRNIVKKARLSGQAYVSHSNKQVPKVKTPQEDCRCKRGCLQKITYEKIIEYFSMFYDMGSKNEQDIFLQQNIEAVPVSRPKKIRLDADLNSLKWRSSSFKYFVPSTSGTKLQVCKSAFQNIYGISSERIRRLCNLLKKGIIPCDQRGKHPNKRAIPGEVCVQIEEHIKCFPLKLSHYASKQIYYLDARLDVRQMFELFKRKYPETRVKYEFYLKKFNERFSLRFGRPQVDTCCTCEDLTIRIKSQTLNENAKRVAKAQLVIHKKRSQKFYQKLRVVKEICTEGNEKYDDTVLGLAFDYMMNLQLPQIPVQETFYLRQLTVNVFCITNLKTNMSKFYIYHEGVGGKGPNEVTSFVNDYINTEVPPGIKTLYVFSDNCGGQNKNHTFLRYFAAMVELKKFSRIEQCYPVRGHSFLPCDRAFGCVKKKLKKEDRLYSIWDFVQIVTKASPKFFVHVVQPNDIINFKAWWKAYYKKSCLSDCSYGRSVEKKDKIHFTISTYSHFIHSVDNIGKVKASEFIDNQINNFSFTLRFSKKSCISSHFFLPSELAYSVKKPINIKKIEDIKKLISYVPDTFKDFYDEILEWPTTTVESVDEVGDDA